MKMKMKMMLLLFHALPIIFAMPNLKDFPKKLPFFLHTDKIFSQLIRTSASDATNAQIQLVNQAKSSDPNERLAAVSRIGLLLWNGANLDEVAIAEFVSIGAVPVLVNCLESTDDRLLVAAAWTLMNITNVKAREVFEAGAVPPFVKLLQSEDMEVCVCTAMALANITAASDDRALAVIEAGALPPLVKLLQSENMEVFVCTASALAIIANVKAREVVEAGAVPSLVNLLQSSNMQVCKQTVLALKNIAAASDDLSRAVAEAGALPPLVKLLQSENMELCKQIAWALTNITDASDDLALAVVEAGALPLLVKLLQSQDMDLCESTAWTLKNIAAASADLALAVIEAGALPPLVELLQSQNQEAYEEASWAIGNIIEKIPDLNGCCIDVEHIQIMFMRPIEVYASNQSLCVQSQIKNDEEITFKVLNGIKKVLNNAQNRREKVIELIEKSGGLQKIEQLKTKESEFILKMIEKLQLTKGCVVCFDKKIDFVFIPCWHACVCEECAENIGICPMCRQIISHKQRIYLP